MQALAQNTETCDQAYRIFAVVIACEANGDYVLRSEQGIIENARQAISCLIQPAVDDRVLVETQMDGEAYITVILQRAGDAMPELKMQGGLQLRVEGGALQLISEQGIELTTLKSLSMTSEQLDLRADEGNVFLGRLSYTGKQLISQVEKISVLAVVMDFIVERVTQKSKSSHRVIEEMEYLRSRQMDYQASHNMQLHGKNTLLTADELVKLDGEQVHLG